ncbi:hypothetical protein, partial [Enterococcus faecium]|uniref:hypothetical protein n=1 Tax=Enterococcus faecium TaxID=1352 RepID=UPI000BD4A463
GDGTKYCRIVKTKLKWAKNLTIKRHFQFTTGVCEIGVYSKASGNAWMETELNTVGLLKQS